MLRGMPRTWPLVNGAVSSEVKTSSGPDLNQRPMDACSQPLQSTVLPTELPEARTGPNGTCMEPSGGVPDFVLCWPRPPHSPFRFHSRASVTTQTACRAGAGLPQVCKLWKTMHDGTRHSKRAEFNGVVPAAACVLSGVFSFGHPIRFLCRAVWILFMSSNFPILFHLRSCLSLIQSSQVP